MGRDWEGGGVLPLHMTIPQQLFETNENSRLSHSVLFFKVTFYKVKFYVYNIIELPLDGANELLRTSGALVCELLSAIFRCILSAKRNKIPRGTVC